MKTASAALQAFLQIDDLAFFGADIYQFTLFNAASPQFTITGITNANPAVVSYSGTCPAVAGDTVLFAAVAGMMEINGQQANVTATGSGTISVAIDSSAYSAYTAGGTFSLLTVYRASTFDRPISYGGNIYPVARAAVNRQYAVTGITQALNAVVTLSFNVLTPGDSVQFSSVGGMTQINGLSGTVMSIPTPTTAMISINSSGFSAYTSGGDLTLLSIATMTRSKVSMAVGLTASKVDVTMQADPQALVAGQPVLQAIATGLFDNAFVTIRRCFMTYGDVHFNDGVLNGPAICNLTGAPTGTGDGTILWFAGNVGSIGSIEALKASMEVRDIIYQLNRPTPKNLIGPGCWHELFDQGCTLAPSGSFGGQNFTQTGLVQAGSTSQIINTNITSSSGPAAPSSAPTLSDSGNTGVPIAAGTYWVVYTYVTALGETLPSPEAYIPLAPQHLPHVASPSSVAGATGWNCYIGLESGNEQLQPAPVSPIPFGTPYLTPNGGISQSGILPPTFPTNGLWAQGVATFTSGPLSGLSAYIEASNGSGQISLRVPMIVHPNTGDSISLQIGCDKSFNRCQNTMGNVAHFSGYPLIPTPEQGA